MTKMAPASREVIGKLRMLRGIQKVSAQAMANRITSLGYSVSRAQIANYENGRAGSLPFDFVVAAAGALGTTVAELLAGPVSCPTCGGEPPAGFICKTCGSGDRVSS